MHMRWVVNAVCLLLLSTLTRGAFARLPDVDANEESFTFAVTADMRQYAGPGYNTLQYFRGAVEAIADNGPGAFMISPGDIDPPGDVYWTITQTLGSSYIWYPVVGNHEKETSSDMAWLRDYDYVAVQSGPDKCPETTYSFDYANAHFAVLNEYCNENGDDLLDGDISDYLYNWLATDLDTTTKEHFFVIGHEPAYPQPDADNGRLNHLGNSLDADQAHRDRFWDLLRSEEVVAYICGHTHNYSLVKTGWVWQLDAGHARGLGDTGAPSTFVLVRVDGPIVTYETYRDNAKGGLYTLMHTGLLEGLPIFLPVVVK